MSTTTKLPHRKLGQDGPQVSAIGLGCMSLSGIYGSSDDAAVPDFIRYAIDQGIDFLDSADMYGWGHNEELLGRALKGLRGKVVLATKFGQVKTATGLGVDGRPEYVQAACEASLKRLGIETIDLYYQHRIDPNVPIEDTVGAMARLVEQGKVRYLGLCEARPETIRRAHRVHPLVAVQTEYSLLYRSEAEETLTTTRALGISFVAYSPLGRGFLTGSIHSPADIAGDRRGDHPRFAGDNFARNRDLVARDRGDRARKGLHPGAARAGLAARAGRRHRADTRHQAAGTRRREYRRAGDRTFAGGALADLGGDSAGRGGGRALSRRRHEGGLQVTNAPVPMGRVALSVSRSTA